MSNTDAIKQHFEREAGEFDRLIVALIPDYSGMVEALVASLPFDGDACIKVIDLGCGTGAVALNILRSFPHAQLICLDMAENMIATARAKLGNFQNVHYVIDDFSNFSGEYDAVVSSLALHHLATDDDKRRFYQRIYDNLRPGGVLYKGDIAQAIPAQSVRIAPMAAVSATEASEAEIPLREFEIAPKKAAAE